MDDFLRKVTTDDPLKIQAATWNAMIDAAIAARFGRREGGAGFSDPLQPALEVLIRNDTGVNLAAGSVLRITDWIVSPVAHEFEARRRPVVAGDTPDAATNIIAVLSEAIPADQLGKAVVHGLAVCDVLVNDSGHTFAIPIAADYAKLGSASSGMARILKWETGGSTRRAIVLLADYRAGSDFTARDDSTAVSTSTELVFPDDALTQDGDAATVNVASDSTVGLVDLQADQQLGSGRKIVEGLLSENASVEFNSFSGNQYGNLGVRTIGGNGLPSLLLTGIDSVSNSHTVLAATNTVSSSETLLRTFLDDSPDEYYFDVIVKSLPGLAEFALRSFNGLSAPYVQPFISITNLAGGPTDGQTGTLGPGAEACGGIIINAGSGSFFDGDAGNLTGDAADIPGFTEAAQDAVGAALTDSSRIDFPYDDGAGTITADLIADTITAGYLHASATDVLFGRSTSGAGAGEEIACTAAGRALLDDATASDQRTTLGLGTIATQNANSVSISGGSITGITDLAVADGGTGRSSHTAYAVLCGGTTSTAAQQSIASVGTSGQVLTSNGAGALPTFQNAPAVSDGDKGDITVSSSGTVWSIDAGAVQLDELGLTDSGQDFLVMFDDSAGNLQECNAGIGLDLSGTTLAADIANQTEMEASSSTTLVAPSVQHYHPSATKAWAQWDASSGTPTNQASYNVASYTDNGVGDVTINFTTAFSGARAYSVSLHAMVSTAAGGDMFGPYTSAPAAGSFRVATTTVAFALNDVTYAFAQFFGDQ